MFEDSANLSSDLEWMLESTQVSEALVIEALVKEYYAPVYHLAYSLLGSPEAAHQAVQRSLLAVMANRHRFTAGLSLKTWIYRHAIRECRKIKRQFWRRRLKAQVPLSQILFGHRPEHETQADRLVWACVDHLAPRKQIVALLSYVYRFTPQEIAQALGTSNPLVDLRLAETRNQLNRRLSKHLCALGACALDKKPAPAGLAHMRAHVLASRSIGGSLGRRDQARLEQHLQKCPPCQEYLDQLNTLENILGQSLSLRYRAAIETEFNYGALSMGLLASFNRRQNRRRTTSAVQQTLIGAAILVLVLAAGLFANQIALPKGTPQTVLQTVIVTRVVPPETTPQPGQFGSYLASPLRPDSGADEIRLRIASSRSYWNSLWLEGRVIFYGPPGYIGPPQVYRNQVWVKQTGLKNASKEALVLAGKEGGDPQYVSVINQQGIYQIELPGGLSYLTQSLPSTTQSALLLPGQADELYQYDATQAMNGEAISRLYFPSDLTFADSDIHILRAEKRLGRRAQVVEVLQKSGERDLLWVDEISGIILRWQRFLRKSTDMITQEYVLTGLVINAEFPDLPFSAPYLWRESFRWDSPWKPETVEESTASLNYLQAPGREYLYQVSPPSDFDPSRTELAFQWPTTATFTNTTNISASIFANGLYLGQADIGSPWNMICERSQDGSKLAFYSEYGDLSTFQYERRLVWLDLRNLDRSHLLLPEGSTVVSTFAFSPNSRYLAFWGCGGNDQNCGMYLTDLTIQKNRKLIANDVAPNYLIWSPDSALVAMIEPEDPNKTVQDNLLVVRTSNGSPVYKGNASVVDSTLVLPGEKGVYWGIAFPPAQTGLEGCVSPP
jgi:RNA polymerase sigma-70 factor (ECF subfamily)